MKSSSFAWRILLVLLLTFHLVLFAQDEAGTQASPSGSNSVGKAVDPLESIKFRNLGPAVGGGRVTAVAGVPGQPNLYYAGAAAAGVFKTTDGGMSWKAIFEKQPNASIGALALAPSNPNLIWVGTGEANMRNDVATGKGVYFSPDAGTTWRFMGLADVGQISSVIVNPANPDVVFIGAIGHQWGPNKDRGVFRTTDAGKTWQKVLYVDEGTGVADMAMDPTNPLILYAAMWQVRRYPWMMENGGPNSAIYRSNDGGSTWTKLTEGLPKGPLGRIGLAIARSNTAHVYALIEARQGRLWETRDYGDHWMQISDKHVLSARPFYFSRFQVAPDREDRLYFLSFDILQSDDGGKTTRNIGHNPGGGVHPDHHALWIDPTNPQRMINGNDGGVYISYDGAHNWRFHDNLPIEQFYMVADDGKQPYMLCGGLQDNNAWCGPSNSLSRGISGGEWFTATGGDGEYAVPAGHDTGIIYVDSQNGAVQRLDSKTGLSVSIRPYLSGVSAMKPADLKYRFNWTTPIVVSAQDPNDIVMGANVVFHSTDGGAHWTVISPDLTRNDKEKQKSSGGEMELDLSGAETFDTILSLAISPQDAKTIWVGTDDGQVQVTHDRQKWANVTPKGAPEWCRLQQIEVSPFDVNSAYAAVDCHEVENNKPYVFRTHDSGKTWTSISKGLRADEPARVVRENPNQKGFLVVGTETGVYYSANDGDSWTPLKSNFPTVPIYDIKFIKPSHDIVIATHGRGLFVLDNITPLEAPQPGKSDFKLFSVLPAIHWHTWNKHDSSPGDYIAPNPPSGAVIQYWLTKEIQVSPELRRKRQTPVKITITDASGQRVRTFYGPSKAGYNRVSWDMAYQEPVRLELRPEPDPDEQAMAGNFGRPGQGGPPAAPGSYKVSVTVNGQTETQSFELQSDPRFNIPAENFSVQTNGALEVRDQLSALNLALNRAESLHTQLLAVERLLGSGSDPDQGGMVNASYTPVLDKAHALEHKLRAFQEKVYNSEIQEGSSDDLHFLQRFHDRLQNAMNAVTRPYGQSPNEVVREEMNEVRKELQGHLQQFNELVRTDVADFNRLAIDKGANTIFAGGIVELKSGEGQVGGQN